MNKGVCLDYAVIYTPEEVISPGTVVIDETGRIRYAGPMDGAPRFDGLRLDLRNRLVIPGLIDIHVHGGHNTTFGNMANLEEDLRKYSAWVAGNGVTGFLTSITHANKEGLVEMVGAYVDLMEKGMPGAEPLGIHLEGPFMNIAKKGAQNPEWIRDPDPEEAQACIDAGRGWVKQVTMAPELPKAHEVAGIFRRAGVVVAVAHTDADYDTARKAFEGDWTHVTHTFNAMNGLHHRKPGMIGAVFESDTLTAELIADTIHVHPGAMKVMVRALGTDRVVLITDAMEAAGLPDGKYALLGHEVTVKEGAARLKDGTLAGSAAVLNQCVHNINKEVEVPLIDAVKMATLNPARAMGFSDRLGSIAAGKDASLTVVDEDMNVYLTMVKGEIVYNQL
ncbi:MAG: N-acetylglucosamine-6-phosphate deacetylase [Anaerolineales bacterium]|nr:N-acetylglucosamine-6-phosphate deacetylase [Anaerolineales bacterium]